MTNVIARIAPRRYLGFMTNANTIGELAVAFNQAARQNGTCGRYLTLKGKDGSTSTVSLFFRDRRLYQIQGTSLPSNADSSSGYMILFTNSFSFDVTLPYRGPCFEASAEFFQNRLRGPKCLFRATAH